MMKMSKSNVMLEYELISSFEQVRNKLLNDRYADRLNKPLAYWAMPGDRRLPLAFMGRSLKDLLATPFDGLFATPGVGRKKFGSLVELLNRAANDNLAGKSLIHAPRIEQLATQPALPPHDGELLEASQVSESVWSVWSQTVLDAGLGRESLGRYAPSLQHLPRVIWCTPLEVYASLTLAEIRDLKTHGEKRVRAVIEVFGVLNQMLARMAVQPNHLSVRVVPSVVAELEGWVSEQFSRDTTPLPADIRQALIDPLLRQIAIDSGEQTVRLAEGRLGLHGRPTSVRQAARQMRLTRARIYQLLEEICRMVHVRWPEGGQRVTALKARCDALDVESEAARLLGPVIDLFFTAPRDREPQPAIQLKSQPTRKYPVVSADAEYVSGQLCSV